MWTWTHVGNQGLVPLQNAYVEASYIDIEGNSFSLEEREYGEIPPGTTLSSDLWKLNFSSLLTKVSNGIDLIISGVSPTSSFISLSNALYGISSDSVAPAKLLVDFSKEKKYFSVGNLGFPVIEAFGAKIGMAICNDRRWPETFRVLALKGAEIVLIGYNSVASNRHTGDNEEELYTFHSNLTVQAGAYQNANWVVSVAKAGTEDGSPMVGSSVIVDPNGRLAAQTKTLADEIVTHTIDLDAAEESRRLMFNFEKNRRIEEYGIISTQRSANG